MILIIGNNQRHTLALQFHSLEKAVYAHLSTDHALPRGLASDYALAIVCAVLLYRLRLYS